MYLVLILLGWLTEYQLTQQEASASVAFAWPTTNQINDFHFRKPWLVILVEQVSSWSDLNRSQRKFLESNSEIQKQNSEMKRNVNNQNPSIRMWKKKKEWIENISKRSGQCGEDFRYFWWCLPNLIKKRSYGKIFGKNFMLITYIGNSDNLCLSDYIEQRSFLERSILKL